MVSASSELHRESKSQDAAELAASVHQTILLLLRHIQPAVQAEGISKGQFWALHVLTSLPTASVSAVAKHLAVTAPAVCVTVDQLEAAGLVTRQRSIKDHRTVEVSLTPKGRRVEARVWTRIGRRIAEVAGDLQPEEVETTVRVFQELNRRLEATPDSRGEKA